MAEGPPKALYMAHQEATGEAAVSGLVRKLQRMGYSGTARVMD